MSTDPELSSRIELAKAFMDYAKYLSGLATGSLLLIVAFVGDAFPHPSGINLLLASMSAFTTSVIGSVLFFFLEFLRWPSVPKEPEVTIAGVVLLFMLVSFLVGVICLLVFASLNFRTL